MSVTAAGRRKRSTTVAGRVEGVLCEKDGNEEEEELDARRGDEQKEAGLQATSRPPLSTLTQSTLTTQHSPISPPSNERETGSTQSELDDESIEEVIDPIYERFSRKKKNGIVGIVAFCTHLSPPFFSPCGQCLIASVR